MLAFDIQSMEKSLKKNWTELPFVDRFNPKIKNNNLYQALIEFECR